MNQMINVLYILMILAFIFESCGVDNSKGSVLFNRNCANCHGQQAEGFKNLYPEINEESRINKNLDYLPCIIRYGIHEHHPLNNQKYSLSMFGNDQLSDIDITNIRNYVVKKFLKKSDYKSLNQVQLVLGNCK